MTPQIICSHDENRLILSINGKQHSYSHDKAGKRQAILDGLKAIELVKVAQDEYLPIDGSLQLVATVLYPDGIRTESAYQTVCRVAVKACAHIGFGDEVELSPPTVPFSKRGLYRKRYPAVDAQIILDELGLAGTSSHVPQLQLACTILWNKVGLATYGTPWSKLTLGQQGLIQTQGDEVAKEAGWHKDDTTTTDRYAKPLAINEASVRRRLLRYCQQENGSPLLVSDLIYQMQMGAYGRGFYSNELAPALQTILTVTLITHGYRPTPENGEYRPLSILLEIDNDVDIVEKLAGITPVTTEMGSALLLCDLVTAVIGQNNTLSEWQAEQLLKDGRIGQALHQLGYQTELTWCQPNQQDRAAQHVILKEVRVQHNPRKKLSLAKGLPVHTPAMVLDGDNDNIIYLEIVGHKQSVRANWAALVSKKTKWIGGQRVYLDGMKEHVIIRAPLPCGWVDHILIHKQASIREMNPEEPFFLLDDGQQAIPPLFYAMLNRCLAVPVLADWARYLWENGRMRNLITLLNEGEGQGYVAWRVLPASDEWQEVVQSGLHMQALNF